MTRRDERRSRHPLHYGARLVERREAQRSGGRPRKPSRCGTRAPRETDSQPALVRLADEPLARVRRRVPRKHSGASRRSISSQEEMKTGQGSPRPSMQRMIGRAYSANSGPGKLSHGLSHFVPNKSARCALYFHAKEKIIAHADAASR